MHGAALLDFSFLAALGKSRSASDKRYPLGIAAPRPVAGCATLAADLGRTDRIGLARPPRRGRKTPHMKASRFKITVKGEEPDGSIRLNDLVEQLNALRSTLNQVDQAVSGLKSPSLYYRVTSITMNSPATFVVEAVSKVKSSNTHGRRVVAKLSRDLQTVIAGKRPKEADLELLESYGALARPMRNHLAQVSLEFDEDSMDIPRNLEMRVDEILGPDQLELGSIVGSLDLIDVHRKPHLFKVYPVVGPSSIKCQFPERMLSEALAGIKKPVRIHGELHFKRTEKFPHLIKVSRIELLPERTEGGGLSSLRGIAVGALRGASSTEYVDQVRNGSW